jgi:hypothetical protein
MLKVNPVDGARREDGFAFSRSASSRAADKLNLSLCTMLIAGRNRA